MFKENKGHMQGNLFGVEHFWTKKQKKYFESSTELTFYNEVFHLIDEKSFACLYSTEKSRPNVPINQLVGSLILKHLNDWTYSELFQNLNFNTLTRYAIGITSPEEDVFAEASIFNFQNRLIEHYERTGEDLMTNMFLLITKDHIKKYKVSTNIQRGDSFLVDSKVMDYSKLRLLVEVVKRLFRNMDPRDSEKYSELLEGYTNQSSAQYVYALRKQELTSEYQKMATVYYTINNTIDSKYKESEAYKTFQRVYSEYFKIKEGGTQAVLKPGKESRSSDLKSPDDPEATFTSKYHKSHVGYTAHISETVNPDNKIELITDVVVRPNNVSDDRILESRIEEMKQNMPEWNEYFADGAYGNQQVDILNEKHGITLYHKGIKGRKSHGDFRIHDDGETVSMSCAGNQKVMAERTDKRYKAVFDNGICATCSLEAKCNVKKVGGKFKETKRTYYFGRENILAHKRMTNIERIPKTRWDTRANVEATIKEMKRGMNNGKVRVRRWIRVSLHMIFTAISVNLRRIHLKIA